MICRARAYSKKKRENAWNVVEKVTGKPGALDVHVRSAHFLVRKFIFDKSFGHPSCPGPLGLDVRLSCQLPCYRLPQLGPGASCTHNQEMGLFCTRAFIFLVLIPLDISYPKFLIIDVTEPPWTGLGNWLSRFGDFSAEWTFLKSYFLHSDIKLHVLCKLFDCID